MRRLTQIKKIKRSTIVHIRKIYFYKVEIFDYRSITVQSKVEIAILVNGNIPHQSYKSNFSKVYGI